MEFEGKQYEWKQNPGDKDWELWVVGQSADSHMLGYFSTAPGRGHILRNGAGFGYLFNRKTITSGRHIDLGDASVEESKAVMENMLRLGMHKEPS